MLRRWEAWRNINDVLEGHVALEIECVDRLYLNAYLPTMQVGQVVRFLRGHLGFEIPSPALLAKIGNRFRREVSAFVREREIPVLRLRKPDRSRWDDRKLDHVRPYLDRAEREGRFGVVAIVACQEFQWVLSARDRAGYAKAASFEYFRVERRVGIYYFYILDPDFGAGFIKLCTYAPWPGKVWLNGHEWVKRQARREGIPFTALHNGFASCEAAARLQELCDSLDPGDVQAFFDRGDSRAMALAGALSRVLQALTGFTNKSLRALVADHLGQRYTQSQMRYDLRRLRLHGLIQRLPRSNTYQLTSEGIRVAVFYTKLQNRLLRPLLDANKPPARIEIRRALTTLEHAMNEYVQNAPLAPAPQLHAFPGRSRTSPLVRSASPMSE